MGATADVPPTICGVEFRPSPGEIYHNCRQRFLIPDPTVGNPTLAIYVQAGTAACAALLLAKNLSASADDGVATLWVGVHGGVRHAAHPIVARNALDGCVLLVSRAASSCAIMT